MKAFFRQYEKRLRRLAASGGVAIIACMALLASAPGSAQRAEDPEKFMASIERQGAELKSMTGAEQLYQSCIYCHGKNGNAGSSFYPRLAGQPAGYLKQQLNAYRTGIREHTIMSSLARILSAEEVDMLATYLAAQAPLKGAAVSAVSHEQAARGAATAAKLACTSCHGANYQGQGDYPRLAGQGYDYLRAQMKNFRDGQRRDPDGIMAGLASGLSDAEIKDLSAYLSAL